MRLKNKYPVKRRCRIKSTHTWIDVFESEHFAGLTIYGYVYKKSFEVSNKCTYDGDYDCDYLEFFENGFDLSETVNIYSSDDRKTLIEY